MALAPKLPKEYAYSPPKIKGKKKKKRKRAAINVKR